MNDNMKIPRPSPLLYVMLFIAAIAALGYVALRHKQDYVTLYINHAWRVHLSGEDRVSAVAYSRMRVMDHDSRKLKLQGYGEIRWGKNRILVHKAGIFFNNKLFSKSQNETAVDITLSRDGRAHRGRPEQKP
jgi:hypothetical protein